MASHPTSCLICSKSVSYQGLDKHLFSKTHSQDIINALFKRKKVILEWISEYEKGNKKTSPFVPIYFKSPAKCFRICYPCKHLAPDMKEHICNKKGENAEIIKNILTTQEPVIEDQKEVSIQTDPIVLGDGNNDEVLRLRKQLEALKNKEKVNQDKIDSAFQLDDALYAILSHLQDNNFDSFKDCLRVLNDGYNEVYEKQQNNLGGISDGLLED